MKFVLFALALMTHQSMAFAKSNCASEAKEIMTQLFDAHVNGIPNASSPEGLGGIKEVRGVFVAQGDFYTFLNYANSLHGRVTVKLALNDSCTLSTAQVTEKILNVTGPADEPRGK